MDEHGGHRCLMLCRPENPADVHAGALKRGDDQVSRRVLSQGAENSGTQTELRGSHGLIHGLSAHAQGTGLRPVAGGGDRLGIKALDN